MDIPMSAAPDVDLVIHVIEMRSAAKRRRQRCGPLVAVEGTRRIAILRRVSQRKIGVVGIVPRDGRTTIRLQAVAVVGVVRIDSALRTILCDPEAVSAAVA